MPTKNSSINHCESCLMPFDKDPRQRESDHYCSLCYKNGQLCYPGTDLKEFQTIVYQNMLQGGMNKYKAKFFTYMIKFALRWKNGDINENS